MCAGVEPQHAPITSTPRPRRARAWSASSSGEASYWNRSPTSCGSPALDWATTSSPSARARVSCSAMASISPGPRPQLAPTASTPAAASVATASAGRTPIIVRRLVSKLRLAMTGTSGTTSRAASTAAATSPRSLIVSTRTMSMPPSRRPASCSVKSALASSGSMAPKGANSSPVGPRSPATRTPCRRATSVAIAAPARFSSWTRSARPCISSRGRVPPNVLVVRIRAPAAAYASWMPAMTSGRSTFQSSPGPAVVEPQLLEQRAHAAVQQDRAVAGEGAQPVHGASPSRYAVSAAALHCSSSSATTRSQTSGPLPSAGVQSPRVQPSR